LAIGSSVSILAKHWFGNLSVSILAKHWFGNLSVSILTKHWFGNLSVSILTKRWFGYILGDFFSNTSGHPVLSCCPSPPSCLRIPLVGNFSSRPLLTCTLFKFESGLPDGLFSN
jgi:hypothetical protein